MADTRIMVSQIKEREIALHIEVKRFLDSMFPMVHFDSHEKFLIAVRTFSGSVDEKLRHEFITRCMGLFNDQLATIFLRNIAPM